MNEKITLTEIFKNRDDYCFDLDIKIWNMLAEFQSKPHNMSYSQAKVKGYNRIFLKGEDLMITSKGSPDIEGRKVMTSDMIKTTKKAEYDSNKGWNL